jgi:hypothetical protein
MRGCMLNTRAAIGADMHMSAHCKKTQFMPRHCNKTKYVLVESVEDIMAQKSSGTGMTRNVLNEACRSCPTCI